MLWHGLAQSKRLLSFHVGGTKPLVQSQRCATNPLGQVPYTSITQNPVPMKQSPRPSPALGTTSRLPPLRMCLFWPFHGNGIVHLVTFCTWLLSLSIMCLRFSHAVASVSASAFSRAEYCSMAGMDPFCVSIHWSMGMWSVSTFWLLGTVL